MSSKANHVPDVMPAALITRATVFPIALLGVRTNVKNDRKPKRMIAKTMMETMSARLSMCLL
jgi:hypothetical protein